MLVAQAAAQREVAEFVFDLIATVPDGVAEMLVRIA